MRSLSFLSILGVVTFALSSCSLLRPSEPVVQRSSDYLIRTSSGVSQGQSIEGETVVSWFDIPFAKPPVGDLRWKAPRSLHNPEQILVQRDDTACVQKPAALLVLKGVALLVVRIAYTWILKRRQISRTNSTR